MENFKSLLGIIPFILFLIIFNKLKNNSTGGNYGDIGNDIVIGIISFLILGAISVVCMIIYNILT